MKRTGRVSPMILRALEVLASVRLEGQFTVEKGERTIGKWERRRKGRYYRQLWPPPHLDRDVVTGAREKVDDGRLERIFLDRFVPVVGLVVTNPFHVVVVDTPAAEGWRIRDRIRQFSGTEY